MMINWANCIYSIHLIHTTTAWLNTTGVPDPEVCILLPDQDQPMGLLRIKASGLTFLQLSKFLGSCWGIKRKGKILYFLLGEKRARYKKRNYTEKASCSETCASTCNPHLRTEFPDLFPPINCLWREPNAHAPSSNPSLESRPAGISPFLPGASALARPQWPCSSRCIASSLFLPQKQARRRVRTRRCGWAVPPGACVPCSPSHTPPPSRFPSLEVQVPALGSPAGRRTHAPTYARPLCFSSRAGELASAIPQSQAGGGGFSGRRPSSEALLLSPFASPTRPSSFRAA